MSSYIYSADVVRALMIGEALAVQVLAMRQQNIGGRALAAYKPFRLSLTIDDYAKAVQITDKLSSYPTPWAIDPMGVML